MHFSYRNPQFWKEFKANHWDPSVPTVIRQPMKDFPFTEDLLLRAMKRVEAGLQAGDRRLDVMVSVNDAMKDPRRPLRQLFRLPAGSLDELEANANRVFKKKNFGVIVTSCHASHPEVWNAVAAFLQDARDCINFPVPRAFMDLFYGRYSSKFTGLHKDTQEIFGFVVRGEKRMLAWPFEYLLDKIEGLTPGDRFFNKRLDHIDHRKFRKDAIVLDAKAGDIIYWPNDHWHVSEPISKNYSAMMSLGILRPELSASPSQPSPFLKKLLTPNSHPGQEARAALLSQDLTEVTTWEDAPQKLRWVTGFGFEMGGATADTPRSPKVLSATKTTGSVILWARSDDSKSLVVSSGGQSVVIPYSAELLGILEKVSRGETVTVTRDPKRAARSKAPLTESYWSKEGKRKTRRLPPGRDPQLFLLDWLMRVYAVGP